MAIMNWGVREARAEDVPAVAELYRRHLLYHVPFDPRYRPRPGAHYDVLFRERLHNHACGLFVALDGAQVVGFVLCRLNGEPRGGGWLPAGLRRRLFGGTNEPLTGTIADLFVHEDYRRRGHGSALVRRAMEWFAERGVREVGLGVMYDNEPGRRFWEAQGFQPYRLLMRQALAQPK